MPALRAECLTEPLTWLVATQVHKARLRSEYALPSGRCDVAVKVRHPHVLDETFVDIGILFTTIDCLRRLKLVSMTAPISKKQFIAFIQSQPVCAL